MRFLKSGQPASRPFRWLKPTTAGRPSRQRAGYQSRNARGVAAPLPLRAGDFSTIHPDAKSSGSSVGGCFEI